MNRRRLLSGVVAGLTGGAYAAAQPRYVDGVFVHSGEAAIELLTYTDRSSTGQLRLAAATFEDVPVVDRVHRVLCSLPGWKPVMVWVSTRAIFRNEYAERRQVMFAVRQISIYAVELRVRDAEVPERARSLARAVGGSGENPAYLFITMESSALARHYMVQIVRE